MRNDGQQHVSLATDLEVEPIIVIHPRLPDVIRLVVLLGPQRRVTKVGKKKGQLLVITYLDAPRTAVDIVFEIEE